MLSHTHMFDHTYVKPHPHARPHLHALSNVDDRCNNNYDNTGGEGVSEYVRKVRSDQM